MTRLVGSDVSFHLTTDPDVKSLPFTVSVNVPPPAVAKFGEMELTVGPFRIENAALAEMTPPELTETFAFPAFAMRLRETVAVS